VDVSVMVNGRSIRGSAAAASFRVAADDVIDKLERRTVESKQRPRDRRRAEHARYDETAYAQPSIDEDRPAEDDNRIVKVKRWAIEPMFEEDALARMEELGHQFFIFVNAETEGVAVLYRRNDGRYGLIEPEVG
jgi:putative sigma-54 modulation protein